MLTFISSGTFRWSPPTVTLRRVPTPLSFPTPNMLFTPFPVTLLFIRALRVLLAATLLVITRPSRLTPLRRATPVTSRLTHLPTGRTPFPRAAAVIPPPSVGARVTVGITSELVSRNDSDTNVASTPTTPARPPRNPHYRQHRPVKATKKSEFIQYKGRKRGPPLAKEGNKITHE